mgnify:CR=1 FL=1
MIEWRAVEGYKGLYEVSNTGQVKSLNYKRTGQAHILAPKHNPSGYLQVVLYKENIKKYVYIHRIVAAAFIPNPEEKAYVNHIDGDKTNNNINNLEWVTPRENNLHAYKTGLKQPTEMTEELKQRISKTRTGQNSGKNHYFYGNHLDEEHKRILKESHYTARVKCLDTNEVFNSIKEAAAQKRVHAQSISAVCRGKRPSAGGYKWEYVK